MSEQNKQKVGKLELVKEEEEEGAEEVEDSKETTPSSTETNWPCIIGSDSEYVKLVSRDLHEFYIRRELAEKSETIRNMLDVPGGHNANSTVYLHMISSRGLYRICTYLRYQKHYLEKKGEVDPFVVEPAEALELILAANFLRI